MTYNRKLVQILSNSFQLLKKFALNIAAKVHEKVDSGHGYGWNSIGSAL
jgi:hypothetical protein